MKNKIIVLFILALIACLPFKVLADQDTHGFAAGSLIFPMDDFYQDPADGGALEVYGLIYYLLDYKRADCVTACGNKPDCVDTCGITIYWVIDETKAEIDDPDLQIVADDDALTALGAGAVVRQNDKDGGSTGASTAISAWGSGDSVNQITYRGSLFVIDYTELSDSEAVGDIAAVYARINDSRWSAVEVHEAQVSFTAPLYRKMKGIPPRIALMNDDEDRDSGNAEILESYLRLAGICSESYDILTPYDIAGIGPDGTRFPSKLFTEKYNFLWAPHWTGDDYDENVDLDNNGIVDVQDILFQIKGFVQSGKSMLAECASIEVFEHYSNGLFLTDKGFGHNEGSDDEDWVIYNDVTAPYAQIGDDPIGFEPEGGHLHNWRPYQSGDDYNFDDEPDVTGGSSVYNSTVTRFTVDDTDEDGTVTDADWDYYVGGYAYGNPDFGYVVYLGGHKYAECDADPAAPLSSTISVKFEFEEGISDESFTFEVRYELGGIAQTPVTINFVSADIGTAVTEGSDLVIDLSPAELNDKKIEKVSFTNNTSSEISITQMVISWSGGNGDQEFEKLEDDDDKYWDDKVSSGTTLPDSGSFTDFTISPGVAFSTGCTDNSSCSYDNLAGVRYVLNTLFNIKFTVKSREFVRAPPIVSHPYLYQGSFEYPSRIGHFRRYDVTQQVSSGDLPAADWDTGAHQSYDRIKDANTGNAVGSRMVFTAQKDAQGDWHPVAFDTQDASLLTLNSLLDVSPADGDYDDEKVVINRLRGQQWNFDTGVFDELDYKMGGIMHSAPAIVKGNSRFADREEMTYVGDLYGMLHAIGASDGQEKWAYIPSNMLDKLQNDRTDPYATQDFAAVDASPTARDIYFDHDSDAYTPDVWRTILVSPQGFGGTSIFALDVTDPGDDQWKVLWETTVAPDSTDPATPGGGMGYAYRASLDKVKWPVLEDGDANNNGIANEIIGYESKWMVFVATNYAAKDGGFGGLHVFALDLETGARVWGFSTRYSTPNNDIPGAVTTVDLDNDAHADRVYVGDINGRMWELEAHDGSNPYGTYLDATDPFNPLSFQIPLFDAGVGYPVTVSPAVLMHNGHAILVFGTGGTDWAVNTNTYKIYGVDATAAKNNWDDMSQSEKNAYYLTHNAASTATWEIALAAGEKVWSTPTIAAGQIWVITSSGSMEGADPGSESAGSSKLRRIDLSGAVQETMDFTNKKIRGSLFVSNNHVYMTTFDNEIIQLGNGDFTAGTGNRVVLKSWRHE